MKISCIMCVYNTKEKDLREAIDSILNQTYQDFELIVVDDGSTIGDIKKIILSYKDKRIKYFYKKNQGKVGFARNFGLKKCKGEYVAIMDSDDIALPERFEKEVKFLDSHLDFFCVGSGFKAFPVNEVWMLPQYPCILDCLRDSPVANSSAMYRRETVKKYNLNYNTDYTIGEDFDFWAEALMKGLKFYNFQEVLYLYRRENQGITSKTKEKIIKSDVDKIKSKVACFLAGDNLAWQRRLSKISEPKSVYWLKIFNMPLIKIKTKANTTKVYLFGKIKICKVEA